MRWELLGLVGALVRELPGGAWLALTPVGRSWATPRW